MEEELTFECLGEPDRPITEELCANAGARYASVFEHAEDMVMAALEVKRLNHDVWVKLPFCVTIEAEGFGAEVELSPLYGVPAITHFRYQTIDEIDTLPSMDFTKGRVEEVLRAASILHAQGEKIMLNIEGPFTVLGQLVPSKQIYKGLHRKKERLRELCDVIGDELARYARQAEEHGVDVLSYADPTVACELVSPQMYQELCGEISYEVLKKIEAATEHVVIHLCNKTSVGFEKAGFCTSEKILLEGGMNYGEALLEVIGRQKPRMIGHGCIQRSYCPLRNGGVYKLKLR